FIRTAIRYEPVDIYFKKRTMAIFGITARMAIMSLLPLTGFGIGCYLDHKETERMTMFRDKSALYGRVLKPGEAPSWP
ncbi:AGAP000849-PA-like protein, partial [Gryllus bimaculatus]